MHGRREFIFILAIGFAASFCSMSYELIIARILSSLSLDSVTSQSLTIGCYLLALGCGAFLHSKLKIKDSAKAFVVFESCLAITAALGVHAILFFQLFLEGIYEPIIAKKTLLIFGSQIVTIVLGILSGFEIPLLIDRLKFSADRAFGWVLGVSYVGGFLASITVSYVLIPNLGTISTSLIIALATAVIACSVYFYYFVAQPNFSVVALFPALVLPTLLIRVAPTVQEFYLKSYYYLAPSTWAPGEIARTAQIHKSFPDVIRVASPYQDIDVVPEPTLPNSEFHLFLDHRLQFSSQNSAIYHDLMIHGALNLAKHSPRKALIIGGGDALLVRELLKYPEVESITLVELDPAVIRLAKEFHPLVNLNGRALNSPKVKVVIADGFAWLRENKDEFDCIFIDLPHPHSVELARLYSVEFYRFVERRLAQNGFMVFDFPFYPLLKQAEERPSGISEASTVLQSVRAAGFSYSRIFGFFESFLIASRENKDFTFDYSAIDGKIADISVAQLSTLDDSVFTISKAPPNSIFRPTWLKGGFDGN